MKNKSGTCPDLFFVFKADIIKAMSERVNSNDWDLDDWGAEWGDENSEELSWGSVMADAPEFGQVDEESEKEKPVISEAMDEFLRRNGFDLENLPPSFNKRICNTAELGKNSILFERDRATLEQIDIGNIVGSLAVNNEKTLMDMMAALYTDSSGQGYGGRSSRFLRGDYRETAADLLEDMEPLDFTSDGNHLCLMNDGNHRIFFLMMAREMELADAKTEDELNDIRDKYTLKANVCRVGDFNEI
jgi:uncharacterized Zn finger protein